MCGRSDGALVTEPHSVSAIGLRSLTQGVQRSRVVARPSSRVRQGRALRVHTQPRPPRRPRACTRRPAPERMPILTSPRGMSSEAWSVSRIDVGLEQDDRGPLQRPNLGDARHRRYDRLGSGLARTRHRRGNRLQTPKTPLPEGRGARASILTLSVRSARADAAVRTLDPRQSARRGRCRGGQARAAAARRSRRRSAAGW